METDDAPRPALDAGEIEEGWRLLAAATPGPYSLSAEHNAMGYDIDPLPQGLRYGMDRVEDARAVCWLLRHAEQLLAAAAERDKLAGRIARAQEACGDPGWANDLCECLSCQQVKAAYAAKHGALCCERCGYEGPIGTISCQCYDYSCRGAGEDMRGTGCPHGCGTCPVCMDGERDAWEIVRAIRAALAPAAGEGAGDGA